MLLPVWLDLEGLKPEMKRGFWKFQWLQPRGAPVDAAVGGITLQGPIDLLNHMIGLKCTRAAGHELVSHYDHRRNCIAR